MAGVWSAGSSSEDEGGGGGGVSCLTSAEIAEVFDFTIMFMCCTRLHARGRVKVYNACPRQRGFPFEPIALPTATTTSRSFATCPPEVVDLAP
jgi:hypothetical protein